MILDLAALAGGALALAGQLLPGIYTNEEAVEFARDQGSLVPPWLGVEVRADANGSLSLLTVDAYGKPVAEEQHIKLAEQAGGVLVTTGRCLRRFTDDGKAGLINTGTGTGGTCTSSTAISAITPAGLTMTVRDAMGKDGTPVLLQRARKFRCWASVPKHAPKTDGSADWWFKQGLQVHDRGGRLSIVTDEPEPQRFSLRVRNVIFPEPPNRPSIVLYVHAEDPVRAVSYSWADPQARRLGINLRTIQASCTLGEPAGMEK